jgi:hypothetical protein
MVRIVLSAKTRRSARGFGLGYSLQERHLRCAPVYGGIARLDLGDRAPVPEGVLPKVKSTPCTVDWSHLTPLRQAAVPPVGTGAPQGTTTRPQPGSVPAS